MKSAVAASLCRRTPYLNETATTIYRGARGFSSSADSLELRVPAGQATAAKCKRECQRKRSAGNHIFAAAYVATNNQRYSRADRQVSGANGRAESAAKTAHSYAFVRSNARYSRSGGDELDYHEEQEYRPRDLRRFFD